MPILNLTPAEREVILHRLGADGISDCLADTEAGEHFPDTEGQSRTPEYDAVYDAAYDRIDAARDALCRRVEAGGPVEVVTDDDVALMRDAFEGSTWWASMEAAEFDGKRGAMMRLHNALWDKMRAAFGDDVYSPIHG